MTPTQKGNPSHVNRIITAILALAAVAGWGLYLHSAWSQGGIEEQLRAQTAALRDYQTRYSEERKKAEEGAKEVASLRQELSANQSQVQTLTAQAGQANEELTKTREQLAAAQQGILSPTVGMSPEILRIKPRPTKEDVMAAQEALTQLRFGTVEADGVVGPSTREAIERFQRAAGLPVTGELHAQTLVTLTRSARVVAAQSVAAE